MVVEWIVAVLGGSKGEALAKRPPPPTADFMEWLKDGVVLVLLINELAGKAIKFNDSQAPFKQMENIANFLKTCRDPPLSMRENDLFTSADLYDGKSRVNVINGLIATSRAAAKSGYAGSSIAPKEAAGGDGKKWDVGKASAEVSKLSLGSSQTMERSHIDTSRNITFGAEKSGSSVDKAGATKLSMGSAGVMESVPVSQANNIDFGAKMGAKKN